MINQESTMSTMLNQNSTMVYQSQQWSTKVNHSFPWSTMANQSQYQCQVKSTNINHGKLKDKQSQLTSTMVSQTQPNLSMIRQI
jgi:hypothetical protein